MFEDLSQNIQEAFRKLRGHGKLTDEDITKALKDVRMALLSADVNYKIVRDFEKAVKERALGTEILSHLTPAQSVIKIVDEELAKLMGGKAAKLNISSHPPTINNFNGRSARFRQNDFGGEIGIADETSGQTSRAGCGRYLPSRRDKTVAGCRRTG